MRSTPKLDGGTLTTQEIEVAHCTRYDLGPGYPQIPLADYVRDLYLSDEIRETSLGLPPAWTPEKQLALDEKLRLTIASFLSLGAGSHQSVRATFSGSVALNRALTAVLNELHRRGASRIEVITTTPSIDIMRLFLEEHSEIALSFVESRRGCTDGALDPDAVVEQVNLDSAHPSDIGKLVLLTSPENPTGSVWRVPDLAAIARVCADRGAILLMDHSFLVAGVHEEDVPRIWNVAPDDCEWLAIWDTGKTFGLNEDKLGFVVASGLEIGRALDEAIAVMQFGVARRQKIFFTQLLEQAAECDHVGSLREVCRTNLGYLRERTHGTPVAVCPVEAGTFALLDCARLNRSDEQLRLHLLGQGVGVVAGNVFFHGGWKPNRYLRIALAREPSRFVEAFEVLMRALAQ